MKNLKNVEKIEKSEAYQKILNFFFSFPNKEIGLNELVKKTKISKTNANKIVHQIVKEGFLKKEIIGNSWRISSNFNHGYNKTKKILYNLDLIYESGIVEKILREILNSKTIILFGSYRKGDDDEQSDIDIAIEVVDGKPLRIEKLGIIKKFGYRKNIEVNLHIFSRNKIDINLFSNIANGIVLDGFLEVKKWKQNILIKKEH